MKEGNFELKFYQLIFSVKRLIGFGTYSEIGGCQGFAGPIPPPFFISYLNELIQR